MPVVLGDMYACIISYGVTSRNSPRCQLTCQYVTNNPNIADNDDNPPDRGKRSVENEQSFRYVYSDGLGELFEELDITLLVSTYQAGKLCAFRSRSGRISMLPRTFKKAMGIAADATRIAVATERDVWFLSNEPMIGARMDPPDTYDACYIPRRSHVTSNIDLHEIAWGGEGLWMVNTLFSCLCTIDDRYSFVPRWQPPFITRLSRHDRCHLNGLAMAGGEPAYVTMFAASDEPQGWREQKLDGGIVVHVGSGDVVARNLSMPHSPRVYGDRLWVLDSGNGTLVCVDPRDGETDVVTKFDGYPRGLAFCGRFAFVGLSLIRETEIFGGVPIADDSIVRHCGVVVVDLHQGQIVGRLEFEKSVEEIFDVQVLPGIRYPTIVGFNQDTIQRAAAIGGPSDRPIGYTGYLPGGDKTAADKAITKGLRCLKQEQQERAVAHFRDAVDLAPQYPRAYNNLGYVLLELDDAPGAIEACQQAVRFDPNYHLARNNLGNALRARGDFKYARRHYEAAIRLQPDYAIAHYNLGVVHIELGDYSAAQLCFNRALDLNPALDVAWNRLADAQCKSGNFNAALASHDRALAMSPDNARFHADKALVLSRAHRLEASAEQYRQALEIEPDSADFHSDLGLVLLMKGDFGPGWAEHEWRLELSRGDGVMLTPDGRQVPIEIDESQRTGPRNTRFPQAPWDGSPLDGRTLLIWGEQGIGDEFMFASMFGEIIDQAAHVVIECDHRSIPLMQRSFPAAEFVGKSSPSQRRTQDTSIDFKCAMGSLGYRLRPDEASFSRARTGYFRADAGRTAALRERYESGDTPCVVGIAWRTANTAAARHRNAALDLWHGVFARSGVRFVSLQYGDHSSEIERVRAATGVEIIQDSEVDPIKDLDGFAAQVAAMDLVISIDNSTVHMAGALGRPVWTLLPFSPDWRWMLDRGDSLWYPSMRLFRQAAFGDWPPVFGRVAAALKDFVE